MHTTSRTILSISVGCAVLLSVCTVDGAQAQQRKRAQSSMKFLSTSNYANASGMASAVTSLEGGSWTQFYNPAASAWMENTVDVTGAVNEWIASIKYSSAAASIRPADGRFGVVGFQMTSINYGDLQRTIRADNEKGYVDAGIFSPTALALGLSYSKSLSEQFAVGANLKFVTQDLGAGIIGLSDDQSYIEQSYDASATVIDFGVFYRTGFESLNFAMTVRNFSPDVSFDSQEHELPLTFKMGVSMDVFDLIDVDRSMHSLIVAIDANRPRDYNEQIQVGTQYTFMDLFVLRAGYVFPSDEEGVSLGFGVKGKLRNKQLLNVDYSYSDFGVFSDVSRLSFRVSL